jgi:CRP-like cAMP-binding protein
VSLKHDSTIDHLAQVSLFRGCTRKELHKLWSITTPAHLPAGRVVCEEGQPGHEFFVVVDGQATVTIGGDQVNAIGPGGFFGEMALLDGGPRVATVTAATDMDVLVMSRREFVTLLADVPTVSRRMLEALGARLRTADRQLHPSPFGV